MNKTVSLLTLCLSLFFLSCKKVIGEGPVLTESRPIAVFDGIDAAVSADINYTVSPTPTLEVSGQQNVLDVLETYVSNGTLRIRFRDRTNIGRHERLRITVSGPGLTAVDISGSGTVRLLSPIQATRFRAGLSGSGSLEIAGITTSDLIATVSGSGSVKAAAGTADNIDVRISGSGDADLAGVSGKVVSTHTSGSGTIWVQAERRLNAHVSGSGSVYYRGQPVLSTHISGSGRVRPF